LVSFFLLRWRGGGRRFFGGRFRPKHQGAHAVAQGRPGVGPGLGGDTNSRNGRSKKTLSTQYEDVELVISRDLYMAK